MAISRITRLEPHRVSASIHARVGVAPNYMVIIRQAIVWILVQLALMEIHTQTYVLKFVIYQQDTMVRL